MPSIRILSAAEQVADHLRNEIGRGVRRGELPGANKLAAEWGVNHKTVESALKILENAGVLINQGGRRPRLISKSGTAAKIRRMRVAILPFDSSDLSRYLIDIRHQLEEAGHRAFFTSEALMDFGMDAEKVERYTKKIQADAWIIVASSREVLKRLSQKPEPVFALFGNRGGLSIPSVGPDSPAAFTAVARRLSEFGHRRISLLVRRQHRGPEPSTAVKDFLSELEKHGIKLGDFNVPDWVETKEGFLAVLESLFRVTPPTALFIDEAYLFACAQQYIIRRGFRIPEDVSLVCMDSDPTFQWCEPEISHVRWDSKPVVRRIVRWAGNISKGKNDIRQSLVPAEFIEGGTIGPAPK